jgi:hypothetical protein
MASGATYNLRRYNKRRHELLLRVVEPPEPVVKDFSEQ